MNSAWSEAGRAVGAATNWAPARASAWVMRTGDTAAVEQTAHRAPALPGQDHDSTFFTRWTSGYIDSLELRGGRDGVLWARPGLPLVAGEDMSPAEQVMSVADIANGVGAVLEPTEWRFLNTDLVVQSAVRDIRDDLYALTMHHSFGYHDRTRTGQLISRMTSDLEHINRFLAFGLTGLLGMVLTFAGALTMLLRMSWQLALMGLVIAPPLALVAVQASERLGPRFYQLRQQFGKVMAQLQV
mgnify:CR=1 FL=1